MLNFPWEQEQKKKDFVIGNRWHSSSSVLLRIAQETKMKINTDSVQQTFPHQEILTNHKCQAHVVDSVMLDNLALAIRIQEISGNYHQGHGTRCQFNGCPQYLVTRKSTDLWLQYVQLHYYYFFLSKVMRTRRGNIYNSGRVSQSLNIPFPIGQQSCQSDLSRPVEGK